MLLPGDPQRDVRKAVHEVAQLLDLGIREGGIGAEDLAASGYIEHSTVAGSWSTTVEVRARWAACGGVAPPLMGRTRSRISTIVEIDRSERNPPPRSGGSSPPFARAGGAAAYDPPAPGRGSRGGRPRRPGCSEPSPLPQRAPSPRGLPPACSS